MDRTVNVFDRAADASGEARADFEWGELLEGERYSGCNVSEVTSIKCKLEFESYLWPFQ